MTYEITTQQSLELINTKQELEIYKLKFELQKIQATKASRLEDSLFSPALMPHYQKVAEVLSKSGIIPTVYRNKPEDIFVAIATGYQLGFAVEQSLQDIAVINGRPCLWGDGLLALAVRHPDCIAINEEPIYSGQMVTGFVCTVHRKGHQPHSQTFTMNDAKQAGLLNKQGPWTQYPQRMLQMRARSWAIRDKFADALRGISSAEEIQDIPDDGKTIDAEIVKKDNSQTDKLKNLLKQSVSSNTKPSEDIPDTEDEDALIDKDKADGIAKRLFQMNLNDEQLDKAYVYLKIKALSELTNKKLKMFERYLDRINNKQEK